MEEYSTLCHCILTAGLSTIRIHWSVAAVDVQQKFSNIPVRQKSINRWPYIPYIYGQLESKHKSLLQKDEENSRLGCNPLLGSSAVFALTGQI